MPLLMISFGLVITYFIHDKNIALFHPKGFMAQEQLRLILFAGMLLLAAAVPTLMLLYFTAWKYRESNTRAIHDNTVFESKSILFTMWTVPVVFAIVLAGFMWPVTHKLEPRKTIAADAKPMTIQVISMRWKWVFLYPEQKIATVNFVQLPVNTPVTFELTGDEAPMSSFWIPNLGGQLYSMTSHVNRVNLMAETAGDYPGSSAEINGAGFSGMKFTARASSTADFNKWVNQVKQSQDALDTTHYAQLLKPSENNPVAYYAAYEPSLYDRVVIKYSASHEGHAGQEDHEHHE
jgi:cytochrome o ubiquinol oxidase subunit 2